MKSYICKICGYLYDIETAEKNIEGNPIPFTDLDTEWICPGCGVGADLFEEVYSNRPPEKPVEK